MSICSEDTLKTNIVQIELDEVIPLMDYYA